jgi:DNA-binding MarR family transcriptional regulator
MARRNEQTAAGAALYQVMVETAALFFRMRAAGKRAGLVTSWGGGMWGFLRSLDLHGPATVPQLARLRPVARQRIQRLADEAAEAGLVEFLDNPAHKRSRLLRLTPAGETAFAEMDARVKAIAERLTEGIDEKDLRTTVNVLGQLREKLGST